MNIQERLELFYRRLAVAPPARNADGALALIIRVLEAVEREFCAVPETNPAPMKFEGRMYLPQADNIKLQADGTSWVKTRRHRILIRTNGSLVIHRQMPDRVLAVEFEKSGGFQ